MALLSQSRFPDLWLFMQRTIGGNTSKQVLATKYYCGQGRVLEIGCSVGNISEAFLKFPEIVFTGIDIDQNALAVAKRRFKDVANFRFSLCSLQELSKAGEYFDYVLFAGILHHVDDGKAELLLRDALNCTATNGSIVIYEPEALHDKDGWFFRLFYTLFEQGIYLRSRDALEALVTRAGVKVKRIEDQLICPGIVTRPHVARFNLLLGGHAHSEL